jgi:hypothetical protein
MNLSQSTKCMRCGQEESLYHILCQCPALAGHRLVIFSFAWLLLTSIRKASLQSVLATALWSGFFEGS